MSKARILLVLMASAVVSATSGAAPAAPNAGAIEAEARAAIARYDLRASGLAYNALIELRLPAKQSNRPDPVLDRLLVEQVVALGARAPLSILQRLASETAASDRVHSLLLLATAEESLGEESLAREHYVAAAGAAGATPDQRLSAQIGLARLKLGTDAGSSVTMLRAIDASAVPPARRWEIALQLARALAVHDPANTGAYEAEMAKAWAAAPDGGIADHAVARIAADRALYAARRGDRAKLVTLLAVDRAGRGTNLGQNMLASNLPVCGESGITRDDVAVVEAQRMAPPERPAIALVWASRPGIGQLFLGAARRSGGLLVTDGVTAQFALRCRSAPAADFAVFVTLDEAVGSWMMSLGAYPLSSTIDGQDATLLAAILASRTTRYGANSIMRLPVLLNLMKSSFMQLQSDEQSRTRVNDMVGQISAILDTNGAPEDIKLIWRMSANGMSMATRAKTPAQADAEFRTILAAATTNPKVSRDYLYNIATGLAQQSAVPSEVKEAALTSTLKLFDNEPVDDPRARALALQLYILRIGNGDPTGARTALAGRNLPADLCILANPIPRFVSSNIRTEDYPPDVIYTAMVGLVPAEFDLDTDGHAINGRLLVSDPPYIFDDVTRRGIETIRYDPPRRDGKLQACRARLQNVRWQLESDPGF